MKSEEFKSKLLASVKFIQSKNKIQNVTQYYKLNLISDLSTLSITYTKNDEDINHPAVKSAFSRLKSSSFNYLASCIKLNEENVDDQLEEMSQDITSGPLYNRDEIQKTINSLEPLNFQDLVDALLTILLISDSQIESNEDETAQIFNFFSLYIIADHYLFSRD